MKDKKHWSNNISRDLILEKMNIGLWYWDIINNILEWDKTMYSIYDVEESPNNEAYTTWQNTLHPDWKEKAEKDLQLALDGEKEFDTVFGINTRNGVRYIAGKGEVIRDSNGAPIKMYGFNWDRTEDYLAREELKKSQELLDHNSKLISIGELAAGIGHELNNPITILKGYLNQISNLTKNITIVEKVEHCLEASQRITAITNGLRAFARKEHTRSDYFDLINLLKSTISLVREIYKLEDITIETDFPEDEVFLSGNEGQIQQVFMNLLSNSKYALKNEQKSLPKEEMTIKIKVTTDQNKITILFSDNGPGIPNEIQEKIFTPFYTTKPIGEGTGIGLSMISKIVTDHFGSIIYKNQAPEVGANFELTFPIQIPPKPHPSKKDSPTIQINKEILKGKLALIVDDEENIRDILNSILDELGFSIETATNGLEAFNLCQQKVFDIVITDIRMPKMNGDEFIKEARSKDYLNKSKVICMTGGVVQTEKLIQENFNVDHFLEKPFDDIDLIHLLYNLFSSRED